MPSNIIDTSNELNVFQFGNGIKLIEPGQLTQIKHCKMLHNTGHTLSSILQHPFPIYFETTEHISIKSNEPTAQACGFTSLNDFIGKPAFKYFKKETIIEKFANHKRVISSNSTVIAEEHAFLRDGSELNTLSVRMPWFNNENKIVGLFGCSILLGKDPLAESLMHIAKLGLLNQNQLQNPNGFMGLKIDSVYLTKRELDCLRLTVKGKPAKQVAYELKLSQRTVEEYLENMKRKMKVSSKAALIEKGLHYLMS